jgi:hypothetical protein
MTVWDCPHEGGVTMNLRALLAPAVVSAAIGLAAALLPSTGIAQNVKEQFTGFAINLNSGPTTATVDFTIERWSTEAEREQLLAIIKENPKDPNDKLLRALQKMPKVGYIRTPQSVGWDLHYAHESPLPEGGRRIVLATDRPIGFREARNQPRSIDYPFTIVEVHLDKDNRGSGKILAGTKIYVDKNNNVVLENYGQQPIRFNEIKKVK